MGKVPARLFFICAYLAMAIIGLFRVLPPVTLLDITALITVTSMVTRLVQSGSLSLPTVWEVGFLTILYYGVRSEATGEILQCVSLSTAVTLVVLGHCLAVVAMDLIGEFVGPARPRNSKHPKIARPAVWAIWAICVIYLLPLGVRAAQVGRLEAYGGENSGPLASLVKSACILVPTLVTLSVAGEPRTRLVKGYLYSSPILLSQVAIGTRYVLLCAAAAPLLAVYGPRIKGGRALFRFGVLTLTLVIVTSAMLAFRTVGFLGQSEEVQVKVGLSSEGVLFQTCDLIDYFRTTPHLAGSSALSVAMVLVPRGLWENKPFLVEYWLPRAVGRTGFGPTQSVGTSYVGDGYADFGIVGVALYSTFWGLLIGYGQRVVATAWYPGSGDAHKALASCLLAIVYFGVRSPVTALINVVGFLAVLGAAKLVTLLQSKRRTDAISTQAREALGERLQ